MRTITPLIEQHFSRNGFDASSHEFSPDAGFAQLFDFMFLGKYHGATSPGDRFFRCSADWQIIELLVSQFRALLDKDQLGHFIIRAPICYKVHFKTVGLKTYVREGYLDAQQTMQYTYRVNELRNKYLEIVAEIQKLNIRLKLPDFIKPNQLLYRTVEDAFSQRNSGPLAIYNIGSSAT